MVTVTFVGVGKLGLAYAAYISSHGHTVHCIDVNAKMIDAYVNGIFGTLEPEAAELASRYPMTYSTDYSTIVPGSVCIILVNTPTCLAGYDHSMLESALAGVRGGPQAATIIASTVQPGFCDRQASDVIYNPLFVQIGNVIQNLRGVTDVLVGTQGVLPSEIIDFYDGIFGKVKLHVMPWRAAEVAKLALNSFITMKISFANMIGDALRTHGVGADAALEFIGSDPRIGSKCLKYGWGFGGPCFPRDNRALSTFLRESGSYDYLPVAAHESNERHAVEQARHWTEPTMTGMCYKDNCDVPIVEESHKVKTALILKSMGRPVTIIDTPEIMELLPSELKH
jgi:UDPglucose 6-dehydrogenase